MAWFALVIAGFLEVFGVGMINRLNKKRDALSLILLIIGFSGSFFCLSYAMETLPMGTAYAVWTGIGASGGALIGMFLFGETKSFKRILFIMIILISAIGLKLVS